MMGLNALYAVDHRDHRLGDVHGCPASDSFKVIEVFQDLPPVRALLSDAVWVPLLLAADTPSRLSASAGCGARRSGGWRRWRLSAAQLSSSVSPAHQQDQHQALEQARVQPLTTRRPASTPTGSAAAPRRC